MAVRVQSSIPIALDRLLPSSKVTPTNVKKDIVQPVISTEVTVFIILQIFVNVLSLRVDIPQILSFCLQHGNDPALMSLAMFTRTVGSSWVHTWSQWSCLQHVLCFGVCFCTSWEVAHRIHQLLRGLTWRQHCRGAEKANWSWKLFGASRNYHRPQGLAWNLWENTSNITTGVKSMPKDSRSLWEHLVGFECCFFNNGRWKTAS